MKPGTRFKLQCEVDKNGLPIFRTPAGGIFHICTDSGRQYELTPICGIHGCISDIVEPREIFIDVTGRKYEKLRPGEEMEQGDLFCFSDGNRTPKITMIKERVTLSKDCIAVLRWMKQ